MSYYSKYFIYGVSEYSRRLLSIVITFFMWIYLFFLGVSPPFSIRTYGWTSFRIHPKGYLTLGENVVFRSAFSSNNIGLNRPCFISVASGGRIDIGNGCGLSGAVICAHLSITLGDNVMLGGNVTILDNDRHPLDAKERAEGVGGKSESIIIGSDVWVGMNSTILKGVKIGNGTVVGANSLVVSDLPENCVAAGIPARVIRYIGSEHV